MAGVGVGEYRGSSARSEPSTMNANTTAASNLIIPRHGHHGAGSRNLLWTNGGVFRGVGKGADLSVFRN